MLILQWTVYELLSYSLLTWAGLIAITIVAARFGRLLGLLLAHLIIAVVISMLDVRWIQSEMAKPGWNGLPDQDGVFYVGVVLRIILINTVLLPVAYLAMRLGQAARRAEQPLV